MATSRRFPDDALDPQMAAIKLPPHSLEAEQSLIGGILLDNSSWERVADLVNEADFYRDDHRRIYRHISKLIDFGKPADVVTVFESLEKNGEAEQAGGLSYLAEIANNTPSAANIRRYAEIVRERAILRKLVAVGDNIAASALSPSGKDAKMLLDEAEARVFEIAEAGARNTTGFQVIQPILKQVVDRVQELYDRDSASEVTGVPSGFADLDAKTSGLQPSDMLIVAGRPAMGKTTFALNVAEHVAVEQRLPVAIFSMEMPGTQLATRFIASVGRIDMQKIRSGRLTDDDWQRLTVAMGKLYDAPLYIDETPGLNPIDLRARARRLARQCGRLGLIVIDYLQLMSGTRDSDNRASELSEISRSVKSLAKELHVPIIALSQLNRSLEQRPNKRPVMSDLRESGAIEQDADIIMFIYRDEVYNPDSPDKGTAELIIGKHRNGPTGTVRMTFFGEYTRFENFAGGGGFMPPDE
ncbi:MAG: replicative DNA helicase [Betaproteobacteria bacterium HGW-Betaproteobacteria-13]|jgi:replicative DNA helicase|uniref:Replicative DNA helicase n=1 Tax=Parazoarcus communis TaxID=41977 RepID=A0A2U8GZ10_9RHOO|nr:replicative DNA helicase [Parazoarcus communis]AWI78684.1 replicative DNA helicase [Parazoarcus communis]PKO56791.1 MAG: replicative DNA helicase [Betaproteobacteria bacterium HGW-Betaproteobacteria-19]PKO79157.1 MAG: replicative DNA helicase [Betaproteobacteria bacterium HGW-Betaproteobacteria-13]